MADLRLMTLGQVVDFTISYNKRQKRTDEAIEKRDEPKRHRASQAEIDAFFG